uniref:Oxidoreductase-like domain-containing protein n=1 Tax=Setaria digitata TaxID=48799 RepID=A0A915PZ61_9BILA
MRRILTASNTSALEPFFLCRRWAAHTAASAEKSLDHKSAEHDPMAARGVETVAVAREENRRLHPPKPPDPSTCCGSGCTGCVWIEYATELIHYYRGRPLQHVMVEIDRLVSDIGLREFIKAEIRTCGKY